MRGITLSLGRFAIAITHDEPTRIEAWRRLLNPPAARSWWWQCGMLWRAH